MAKLLNALFWILGVFLFVWAVRQVDLAAVGRLLADIRFGFIPILGIALFVSLMGAYAWVYAFKPGETRGFRIWRVWEIRQIGEAFNLITPLGTLGGEPVKAHLMKSRYGIGIKAGVASQVIQRTTTLLALILFLAGGMVLIAANEQVSAEFKRISLQGLVIFSTLIFLFLLFQITGILNRMADTLKVLPPSRWVQKTRIHLRHVSDNISDYYRGHPKRCAASTAYAFLGWVAGILELQVTLYFLGHSLSFTELWIVESLSQLVRSASFFIPLSIGAQETGLVLIFTAMGMGGSLGLVVSFVRRIKELMWVAVGLVLGRKVFSAPWRKEAARPSENS